MAIQVSNGLFGVPGSCHLAFWISCSKEPGELSAAVVIEALVGSCEKAPAPVERIGLATAVSECLVLHPATALI
jgi:hypothetical protein